MNREARLYITLAVLTWVPMFLLLFGTSPSGTQ